MPPAFGILQFVRAATETGGLEVVRGLSGSAIIIAEAAEVGGFSTIEQDS